MKANELRIGNWVYNQTMSKNTQVYPMMIPQLHRIENENGSLDNCNIKPIPLTEEILLKCGFQKYAPSIFNENRYVLGFISLIVTTSKDILFNGIHIKHLHQLQNLFYCLCGEELEINF